MVHAILQERLGGPEVLEWREIPKTAPGPGEVRVRHLAIGVNFVDVYMRTGLYPRLELPGTVGVEGAGIVEAIGDGVTDVDIGDRVAYVTQAPGSYAESRNVAADAVVVLPPGVDEPTAASILLKGMTAEVLLHRTHTVAAGDVVVVHAAAGATGSLLASWAKHLGARVIGTAGDADKADRARAAGCEDVVLYRAENLAQRVQDATAGRGADVVYDGVGAATFQDSLDSLCLRGHLVSFGNASGPVRGIDLSALGAKSISVTRPSLFHYIAERAELEDCAAHVFEMLEAGVLRAEIGQSFALSEAATAHRALEGRRTHGATLLLP